MNFPKKIYLQQEDGEHPDCDNYFGQGMTWCEDKINKNDAEYIRADLIQQIAQQAVDERTCDADHPFAKFERKTANEILSRIKELTEE